jgi:hypothetical protein
MALDESWTLGAAVKMLDVAKMDVFLNYISVPYIRTDFLNDFEILPFFSSLPL